MNFAAGFNLSNNAESFSDSAKNGTTKDVPIYRSGCWATNDKLTIPPNDCPNINLGKFFPKFCSYFTEYSN